MKNNMNKPRTSALTLFALGLLSSFNDVVDAHRLSPY